MSAPTQRTLVIERDKPATPAFSLADSTERGHGFVPRRRGRPPLLTPDQVLGEIRTEAAEGRLFRVHLEKPALYARARRLWGSWAEALRAAGLDPRTIQNAARQRALETRRLKRGHALL